MHYKLPSKATLLIDPASYLRSDQKAKCFLLNRWLLRSIWEKKWSNNTNPETLTCFLSRQKKKLFSVQTCSTTNTWRWHLTVSASNLTVSVVFSVNFSKKAIRWTSTNGWCFANNSTSTKSFTTNISFKSTSKPPILHPPWTSANFLPQSGSSSKSISTNTIQASTLLKMSSKSIVKLRLE